MMRLEYPMVSNLFNAEQDTINQRDVDDFKQAYNAVLNAVLHAELQSGQADPVSHMRGVENIARNWIYSGNIGNIDLEGALEESQGAAHEVLSIVQKYRKTAGLDENGMREVLRPLVAPQDYPELAAQNQDEVSVATEQEETGYNSALVPA